MNVAAVESNIQSVPVETTSLPPGPRAPRILQTRRYWGKRDEFMIACQRRYGDVFTLNVAPAGTVVCLADPADIQQVFTGDRDVFHAGESNRVLAPVMGESSVLITDGDRHLTQRRRMLPAFHGDSVRDYEQTIVETTEREMATWPSKTPFALHPRMQAITLDVIMRAVIGVREAERLEILRPLLRSMAEISPLVMLMWVQPWLRHVGPWRNYNTTKARVDQMLFEEIARRAQAPDLAQRRDILSMLMAVPGADGEPMTDVELRDQLVTLLLAGHETTATGLAWAFERLLRDPMRLTRLTDEIAAGGKEYLDAVVKEILRVRPVIFDVVRMLKAPASIRDWTLPAGVTVSPSIGLVHRSENHYEDALAFRPERFLEGEAPPYGWIPFGGGIRRCLGAAFATFEMEVVLRTVLSSARLTAPDPRPEQPVGRHITLIPSRGTRVVLAERLQPEGELKPC
jgi:cytochrome P450 family 135